ncbi:SGNH/GDSL hydrolase family protein [Mucilaginibacter pedocola]|uniref:Uncharacterized protein n=1 Tax=Mucilaginibacter pedocola TaxID=1792845 RepID=A0A1S9PCL6_9SPHI|nr:hypothetical protein [Mucilaginibacter pedocola]OOQ58679.1 hypothetical protein BC343_08415 [Mucilaginibacter pedocola]
MAADHKLILKRFAILIVCMFLLDWGIGAVLKHFYFTKKSGADYRTNYVINSVKSDVLIFGSSKAVYHYDAKIICDSLKLSVYNAGRDLSYIYYHYALLESALRRYTPKLVVLDTRANEFFQFRFNEDRDRLNVLLPFYDSHPELQPIIQLRGEYEKYKLLSKMYPYNSLVLNELVELLPLERYKKDDSQNGYIAKYGSWKKPKEDYTVRDAVDTTAAGYYKKFVELCKAKNVPLVVVYSPIYQNINPAANRNVQYVMQLCEKNNVPVWNYLTDSTFNNPAYYFDALHLNRQGSALYSSIIGGKLKQYLNNK